jgi:hypothetical protein
MRNAKLKEVLEHAGRVADLAPAANFVRKVPQADIGRSSYRLRFRDRQTRDRKSRGASGDRCRVHSSGDPPEHSGSQGRTGVPL